MGVWTSNNALGAKTKQCRECNSLSAHGKVWSSLQISQDLRSLGGCGVTYGVNLGNPVGFAYDVVSYMIGFI
jgi:hypothetical protein